MISICSIEVEIDWEPERWEAGGHGGGGGEGRGVVGQAQDWTCTGTEPAALYIALSLGDRDYPRAAREA